MADVNPGDGNLPRHWKYGAGAAEIGWTLPGDFTRCVLKLRSHVGAKAEAICAQWHHDMNGFWPGDKRNR